MLAGFLTQMCVNCTAEGAFPHGQRPTVAAQATATRALTAPDESVLPAATLKAAALTGTSDFCAHIVPTVDALAY